MPGITQSFNTAYQFSQRMLQPRALDSAWALPPQNEFQEQLDALTPAYNLMAEAGWEPAAVLCPPFDTPQWTTIFSNIRRLSVNISWPASLLATRHEEAARPNPQTTWELGVIAAGTQPPLRPNKITPQQEATVRRLGQLATLPLSMQIDQLLERVSPTLPTFLSLCIMDYHNNNEHGRATLLRGEPSFGLWAAAALKYHTTTRRVGQDGFSVDVLGASIKMSATPRNRASIRPTVMASDLTG